jgi:ribonuclease D
MKRDFGFVFSSLFDTMIAARLLGRSEIGLAAVVRDELGLTLTKGNQKDDWSRRPLTPDQEAYALADVLHLVALRESLARRLEATGRLEWLREECEAVEALEPSVRRRDPDAYLSVKGARRLAPRALAALRELFAWREERAEKTDTPAFRILGNETLLRLAQEPPGAAALPAGPGLPPRMVERHGPELLGAIRRAHALPESELPVLPRSPRPVVPDRVVRRIDRLKAWRVVKAAEMRLDVSVVLPQRLVERLAESGPRSADDLAAVAGLRRWRVQAFGPELLRLLQ